MRKMKKASVYMLHFERPYRGKCQHYVGYTTLPLGKRLKQHRNGSGAVTTAYAIKQGIDFVLGYSKEFATGREARREEIRMKKVGNFRKLCLICKAHTGQKQVVTTFGEAAVRKDTRQKRTEEEVKIVAKAVVEYNREAFKELERL